MQDVAWRQVKLRVVCGNRRLHALQEAARILRLRLSYIHGARLPARYGALYRVGTSYQLQVDPWRQVKVCMVCGERLRRFRRQQ